MVAVIINPGTEGRTGASLENAQAIVDEICDELTIPRSSVSRTPSEDDIDDGFFGFTISSQPPFVIQVPGDDPGQFFLSKPWVSRRMYVDGSSWLWAYAAGKINRCLGREE